MGLQIEGRSGGPFGTVSYWLTDEATGAWALVDPIHDVEEVWEDRLQSASIPEAIFVTHGHIDHVGGAAQMRRRYPETRLWIHPDGKLMLEDGKFNGASWTGLPYFPTSATDFYRGGDQVRVGGTRLDLIEAPGHCPGSVLLRAGNIVLGGDVLFRGGVGRWDLPGADYDTLARTMREKVMTLPDETIVYPGHGPATTIGDERAHNDFVAKMLAGEKID